MPLSRTVLLVVLLASGASGAVLVVGDDKALASALRHAGPGDTILLEPGTYRGGLHARIRGEPQSPVTVAGADPDRPPVIEGGDTNLQFAAARHLVIRDIVFRGAQFNGLNVDDGGQNAADAVGIVIERVRVEEVALGPSRNGIKLSGVGEFVVRDSSVAGWGGSGIDMVGCRDGVVERCRFTATAEAHSGIQMKGGTQRVTVRRCVFDNAGRRAINAGGHTGKQFFRPPDATYEAQDLTVEDNHFQGGETPIAFVGLDGGTFRHNTIVEPVRWVFRVLQENREGRFVPCRNVRFEHNLILFRAASVAAKTGVNIGPGTAAETFRFVGNGWWCMDDADARIKLPAVERDGVHGIDPKLSADGRATEPRMKTFGIRD